MGCGHAIEKLQAYVDQELNLSEMRAISQHLESCESCAEKTRLSELVSELIGERRVELSSDFIQKVRQQESQTWEMEEMEKTSELTRRGFILTTLISGLVLIVAAIVGVVGMTALDGVDYFLLHAISTFLIIGLLKNLTAFDTTDYFLSPPPRSIDGRTSSGGRKVGSVD